LFSFFISPNKECKKKYFMCFFFSGALLKVELDNQRDHTPQRAGGGTGTI